MNSLLMIIYKLYFYTIFSSLYVPRVVRLIGEKNCSLNEESTKFGMLVCLGVLSNISYGPTLKNQYGRHFQDGRHIAYHFKNFFQ